MNIGLVNNEIIESWEKEDNLRLLEEVWRKRINKSLAIIDNLKNTKVIKRITKGKEIKFKNIIAKMEVMAKGGHFKTEIVIKHTMARMLAEMLASDTQEQRDLQNTLEAII